MSNPHPKAGPGRPAKGDNKRNTEMAIRESAPFAANYLKQVSKGEVKPEALKVRVAEYVVNQTIGCAATKVQSTEAITITIKQARPPIAYNEVPKIVSVEPILIEPIKVEECQTKE